MYTSACRANAQYNTPVCAALAVAAPQLTNNWDALRFVGSIRPGSTAWKDANYFGLQEVLVEEYALEDRFENLDRKVGYINETIKYAVRFFFRVTTSLTAWVVV